MGPHVEVEKSELCSSLWAFCDELHCGINERQRTDYFLLLQFVKCDSDRLVGQPYAAIMELSFWCQLPVVR
jgi:type I restriction-modification system DNA methylase subunit